MAGKLNKQYQLSIENMLFNLAHLDYVDPDCVHQEHFGVHASLAGAVATVAGADMCGGCGHTSFSVPS